MKSWSATIKMKATEQYFPMVEFIMLYKVFLTFEFVDKILRCDHSSKNYQVVYFPVVLFQYYVEHYSWVCGWNPKMWPLKWKLLSSIS